MSATSLFFKNHWLAEVIYLVIGVVKSKFFPRNTKNADVSGCKCAKHKRRKHKIRNIKVERVSKDENRLKPPF